MRIFLAGIMQGSHTTAAMHNQDYRSHLRQLLQQHWPEAQVYDPLADHADSLDYSPRQARDVFLKHNRMCGETDVLLAFVPEASMGTAIEMWEAATHGKIVVTVSPLHLNWAIRFCSDIMYAEFDQLVLDVATGNLQRRVKALQDKKQLGDESR
jgi:hypothetical protein